MPAYRNSKSTAPLTRPIVMKQPATIQKSTTGCFHINYLTA
ncbi:hypothetical protein [Paenibacillus radicibacter]|nr:hypothetical protein [Paenibacillus radicibacter]